MTGDKLLAYMYFFGALGMVGFTAYSLVFAGMTVWDAAVAFGAACGFLAMGLEHERRGAEVPGE